MNLQENNSFVICDKNVAEFARREYGRYPIYQIVADEEHKNIETVTQICRYLMESGADRSSTLIAIGGGVTTDLVGFAAGIYKRGIKYINVPTTLLSQVDAGLGGKTGCNLDSYKNIIGLTHFPSETIIRSDVLKTLPERELRSGAAEMLKTFLIKDGGNYEKAVKLLSAQEINYEELEVLIKAASEVKKEIVSIDPYEKGLRRVLNLGHSFAHAIEWYQHRNQSSDSLSHGEAVAIGIIEAAKISQTRGLCPKGLAAKLAKDFASCHLPTELPAERSVLIEAMRKDKKAESGRINFVLLEDIGKVRVELLEFEEIITPLF